MAERSFNPLSAWFTWTQSVMEIWWGKSSAAPRRARAEHAVQCAQLHAASFAHPWNVLTFEQLLADARVQAHVAGQGHSGDEAIQGFILSRIAADEAEILSVAVADRARRAGLGRRLVETNLDALARERVNAVFLEVEAGNAAAIGLYRSLGFQEVGRRKGYYRNKDGIRDALTMRLDLASRPLRPPVLDA